MVFVLIKANKIVLLMFALSSVIYFSTVGRYTYIGMYSVRAAGILAGSEI